MFVYRNSIKKNICVKGIKIFQNIITIHSSGSFYKLFIGYIKNYVFKNYVYIYITLTQN